MQQNSQKAEASLSLDSEAVLLNANRTTDI